MVPGAPSHPVCSTDSVGGLPALAFIRTQEPLVAATTASTDVPQLPTCERR